MFFTLFFNVLMSSSQRPNWRSSHDVIINIQSAVCLQYFMPIFILRFHAIKKFLIVINSMELASVLDLHWFFIVCAICDCVILEVNMCILLAKSYTSYILMYMIAECNSLGYLLLISVYDLTLWFLYSWSLVYEKVFVPVGLCTKTTDNYYVMFVDILWFAGPIQ